MNRIHTAAVAVLMLVAVPARAADPVVRCESGKLKETAKYASCRLKAHASAVSKNLAPDFSKCDEKYAPKFEQLEEKAGSGVCPSEDDTASIQARVTADTDDLATLLGGGSLATCGDGTAEEDEDCDGSDLAGASCVSLGYQSGTLACTSSCRYELADCSNSCESCDRCGNGVIDGDEDCDWRALNGASCASRGYAGGDLDCSPGSCTFDESNCIPAGCGDGNVDSGEICDGNCPTCDPQPACFENTGDDATCDVRCGMPVLDCRAGNDGCCPYLDAGSGCSSTTDADCAGTQWRWLEWPYRVSWNAGQCSTVAIYGVNRNDNYLFTTCHPAGGESTTGDPVITSVVDSNGQAYSVADDDCSPPSAIPNLAGWVCSNTVGSRRDACAPANSGGFIAASGTPISRLNVTICGHAGTAGSARLFIWWNGSSNPNPG